MQFHRAIATTLSTLGLVGSALLTPGLAHAAGTGPTPQPEWHPDPETVVICELFGLLDGLGCHGDNLGDAADPIDASDLTDWWEDSGPFRDIADNKDLGDFYDWATDWLDDNADKLYDWYSGGDPHLTSTVGEGFDMLAVGDFTYTQIGAGADRLEVQARHAGTRGAAVIGAIAVEVGEANPRLVEIYAGPSRLVVDGSSFSLDNDRVALISDEHGVVLSVVRHLDTYVLLHRSGHAINVWWGAESLAVEGTLAAGIGEVPRGALGGPIGLTYADGTKVVSPVSQLEWTRFMGDWSVDDEDSLFTRGGHVAFEVPSNGSRTVYDLPTSLTAPQWSRAEALVGDASDWTLEACVYDLALLGDSGAANCSRLPKQPSSVIEVD